MTRKHVGIDLHTSTTSQIAVRDDDGDLLFDPISVKTQPEPMLTALKAISGEVHVMFEGQTGSKWLRELLEPHVERVVVCHAADNEKKRGSKTDKIDAADLSERLWRGDYTAIYQESADQTALKELVHRYLRKVDKLVRAKNQLKALYRQRNIPCEGSAIFAPAEREHWLDKLDRGVLKESAEELFDEIDFHEQGKGRAGKAMVAEAKRRSGWDSVNSLPGFGEIRTAKILGLLGTPWRFPGKRQLWRYSCLSVVVHDTKQWVSKGPDGIVHHREQKTRGLNNDGRKELKAVFKGAAKTAISQYPEVHQDFEVRCQDKHPDNARLDIARKLASQCLTVWKRQEVYDPDKARWKKFSSDG